MLVCSFFVCIPLDGVFRFRRILFPFYLPWVSFGYSPLYQFTFFSMMRTVATHRENLNGHWMKQMMFVIKKQSNLILPSNKNDIMLKKEILSFHINLNFDYKWKTRCKQLPKKTGNYLNSTIMAFFLPVFS